MKKTRTIKAVPNHQKRTFTLYVQYEGKTCSKYRTIKYDKDEFRSKLYNTNDDWEEFLRRCDEYSLIK